MKNDNDVFVKIPEMYYKIKPRIRYESKKRKKKGKKYVYFYKNPHLFEEVYCSSVPIDGYLKIESFSIGRYTPKN